MVGTERPELYIHYSPPTVQINNLGQRSLPISVVFWIPIKLNQVTVWDNPQVTFSQVSLVGFGSDPIPTTIVLVFPKISVSSVGFWSHFGAFWT